MQKALATFIDICYQLLLYYIPKLKDSFKVYCYENVQKYRECSGSRVLGSLLVIYIFYLVVLLRTTNAAKFLFQLFVSNSHSLVVFSLLIHQKKTTTQFFILLNCCLYIYILSSSFNASCNNFPTFNSFFFYNSII